MIPVVVDGIGIELGVLLLSLSVFPRVFGATHNRFPFDMIALDIVTVPDTVFLIIILQARP